MQQQQPGTVTYSRINSLQISRRLTRPRLASKYSARTQSSVTESGRGSQKFSDALRSPVAEPPFLNPPLMRKKRLRKNKSESKQVIKKSKLATRLSKVKQSLLSKQSQLMYKSQVTSIQKTMHAGKDLLKNRLSTIELMIAGHLLERC